MDTTRGIEVMVGIFVAAGLAALFTLAMQVSNLTEYRDGDGYEVTAYFENIGGLKARAPVTIGGVRVGRVSHVGYDPERFQARVVMTLSSAHDYLPTDTYASIYTAGMLGEQYIALQPGADDQVLGDGDRIIHTQSAIVLEEVIGRVLVNLTTK